MINIKTLNHISDACRKYLPEDRYKMGDDVENPDAIFVRATNMHDYEFAPQTLCIGRAGIGVNTIPLDRCTESGIAVFNTPGANANGVKELFLFALGMGGRDIQGSMDWVRSYNDDEIPVEVAMEQVKKQFVGKEYCGKTLGVIGTGNVGSLVSNIALELEMQVLAYDPYLSVDAAWKVSREVKRKADVSAVFANCDYLTIHTPLTDETQDMINKDTIALMKDGAVIINYARGEVANEADVIDALKSGKISRYICDFPTNALVLAPNTILTPHLGGTTHESEEKCAVMAAKQMANYIENGNIKNSVNLPNVSLDRMGVARLCVIHENVPKMLNRFLDIIGRENINVEHMMNKHRGKFAYTIIDTGSAISDEIKEEIASMAEVVRVRVI